MYKTTLIAIVAGAYLISPVPAAAGDEEVHGTWKLVSSQRHVLETGQKVDTYGPNPTGFITYGKDGRMLALIVRGDRQKGESIEKLTEQQRSDLFKSMIAYGGTYKFHGDRIEHVIDISWNEIWTGTTVVRDIKRDGDRLIYTTKPAPFSGDGKMSVTTLVWEKVK
jgi:hypothetical protein